MARVLVVEDEVLLRRIITLNLARRGYTVAEAESVATAQEALEASATPFDLILLDVNLPDQTGWDLLRCSKINHATPQVIVLTAVPPAHSRIEEFHPCAVLLKPFPMDALLRLIERVLAANTQESSQRRPVWNFPV